MSMTSVRFGDSELLHCIAFRFAILYCGWATLPLPALCPQPLSITLRLQFFFALPLHLLLLKKQHLFPLPYFSSSECQYSVIEGYVGYVRL